MQAWLNQALDDLCQTIFIEDIKENYIKKWLGVSV